MKSPRIVRGRSPKTELTIHNGTAPKCTARSRLARALTLDARGPIGTEGHNSCHNNNLCGPSLYRDMAQKANPSQNHRY